MTSTKSKLTHPWTRAGKLEIQRMSPLTGQLQNIDKGVNFFVLALEALGARTEFSCEGHPTGFYVLFTAPYELVLAIKAAGYFGFEVEGTNRWSIRLNEYRPALKPYSETDKKQTLKWATESWLKRFPEKLKDLA
jgi:hypothetical protein